MDLNVKNLLILFLLSFSFTNVNAQQNIFVDQIGYHTDAVKLVYTDYKADSFAVVDVKTKHTLAVFAFSLRKENDPSSGKTIYQGDFSSITNTGKYIIRVFSPSNSGITSYLFEIGDGVYLPVIEAANTSLFLQRCGLEIEEQYAGKYARPVCHLREAEYHHTCHKKGKRDIAGGWHDAGDYGKYVAPGSVTAAVLLNLYQLNEAGFSGDNWNIPESKNGIPDLLDEVKYELDWMFKMQDENGAVHEKIHTKNYVQFIMPHKGDVPQFIYQVSSTATADFAAVMAMASRAFSEVNNKYSKKCLLAATKAYNYLERHKEIFPKGGFKNPNDTHAGGYSDAYDEDERIWAAAELYISTQKKKYLNDFQTLHQKIDQFSEISWINPSSLGFYSTLLHAKKSDLALKDSLTSKLLAYCDRHIEIAKNDGFGIAMKVGDYTWGSNGSVASKAMNFILAYKFTKDKKYRDLAAQHMHYIFGVNANKKSYVTGFGTNTILHLHHAPSVADAVPEPIPGILSGGPNKFRNDESLVKTFAKDTPPALIFLDNEESYSSNENTIYTNVYMVFVLGLL